MSACDGLATRSHGIVRLTESWAYRVLLAMSATVVIALFSLAVLLGVPLAIAALPDSPERAAPSLLLVAAGAAGIIGLLSSHGHDEETRAWKIALSLACLTLGILAAATVVSLMVLWVVTDRAFGMAVLASIVVTAHCVLIVQGVASTVREWQRLSTRGSSSSGAVPYAFFGIATVLLAAALLGTWLVQ
jgi:hypothetical protein